jgi:hypothetical protein
MLVAQLTELFLLQAHLGYSSDSKNDILHQQVKSFLTFSLYNYIEQ